MFGEWAFQVKVLSPEYRWYDHLSIAFALTPIMDSINLQRQKKSLQIEVGSYAI